jgi:hypothetical protein
MNMQLIGALLLLFAVAAASGFSVSSTQQYGVSHRSTVLSTSNNKCLESSTLMARLSDKRKKELGVADDEDEYDLSLALSANTDPLITKLIAGSLILVILGLLIVAVIIPLTSEPVLGLCNPILNAGRC